MKEICKPELFFNMILFKVLTFTTRMEIFPDRNVSEHPVLCEEPCGNPSQHHIYSRGSLCLYPAASAVVIQESTGAPTPFPEVKVSVCVCMSGEWDQQKDKSSSSSFFRVAAGKSGATRSVRHVMTSREAQCVISVCIKNVNFSMWEILNTCKTLWMVQVTFN